MLISCQFHLRIITSSSYLNRLFDTVIPCVLIYSTVSPERQGARGAQWRNFARGCPWARDGWVPHWLRSACAKCKKIEARNACEPCGAGFRGPLIRAPVGSRGKAPGGGPKGRSPPEAPVHFNADTAFPTQTYKRQIVKLKTLKQIKIRQYST